VRFIRCFYDSFFLRCLHDYFKVASIEARRARLEGKMANTAERADALRAEKMAKAARMSRGKQNMPPPPQMDANLMPPPPGPNE
jgi:hypothetical protein